MQLHPNDGIISAIRNLESEIQRLKDSEASISRPSAIEKLWDTIRLLQKKVNRLYQVTKHCDSAPHFNKNISLQPPRAIALSHPQPQQAPAEIIPVPKMILRNPAAPVAKQQNSGSSWGTILGGAALIGAVTAIGFYLFKNMSVTPEPPVKPPIYPGSGNGNKPPVEPPVRPPIYPGCGNGNKPPVQTPPPPIKPPVQTPPPPPPPPPSAPKPKKKHHHHRTWHVRPAKVFGVPVGIKFEKK